MGWLGSVCRSIGRGVGKVCEKVGSATGWRKLENFGNDLQHKCRKKIDDVARDTGETESYDKETARLYETQRINEALSQFSLSLEVEADSLEEATLEECKVYFEFLLEELRNTNEENGMRININRIKRELFKIEKGIKGSFKNHLAKRVSLDDRECLSILKLEAGKQKEEAMKRFGNKVFKQAKDQLCDQIKECLLEQQEYIEDYIMDQVDETIKHLEELAVRVSEFEAIKKSDESKIEIEKVKCLSKIEIINQTLALMK